MHENNEINHFESEQRNVQPHKTPNPNRLKILLTLLVVAACFLGISNWRNRGLNAAIPHEQFRSDITLEQLQFDLTGDGTEGNPYRIQTDFDLASVATAVSNGFDFSGEYFALENDIDLSDFLSEDGNGFNGGAGWRSIGRDVNMPFSGNFDGAGHTISGLWIDGSEPHTGLFGFTADAHIKNLRVEVPEGKSITSDGGVSIGVLAGFYVGGTIENCHVSGSIILNSNRDFVYAGGLVGAQDREFAINNSVADVNIYATGTSENASVHAGGLIGASRDSSIINCVAQGNVTATGYQAYAGGLLAQQLNSSIINYCVAQGNVTTKGYQAYAGGLLGQQWGSSVKHCEAHGDVSSYATLQGTTLQISGGLIGDVIRTRERSSNIDCSLATGNVYAGGGFAATSGGLIGFAHPVRDAYFYLTDCYATGGVSASARNAYSGGLIGQGFHTIAKNCYATGLVSVEATNNIFAGGFSGSSMKRVERSFFDMDTTQQELGTSVSLFDSDAIGMRTPEMMKRETFVDWDFDCIWDISEGQSYPFLR